MSLYHHPWVVHWVRDPFWGVVNNLAAASLRALPSRYASELGRYIGTIAGRTRFRDLTARSDRNLQRIRPDLDPPARERVLQAMWENVGRVNAEMPVIDRLWEAAQVTLVHDERLVQALRARRPAIFVFAHLGNWELLAIAAQRAGFALDVIYEILRNRFEIRLALRLRQRLGYRLVPPTLDGVRQIFQALGRGDPVGIAIDEFKNGNVVAPAFGRILPADANMRFAVRLARKFNALLVPAYCLRTSALSFRVVAEEPIADPDVDAVNARFEALIRAHSEQWYMLHRLQFTA
jgi:KDO2-lipid IV(A) lauroyltransferase